MKAYQMKIVIKNSKPPIWRRCIIPAGITFSQLSIILNKIMGWSGNHLSEFEFYHLKLQIREDDDICEFVPLWDYDLLDSSKTFINEYMEKQEWFTYTYDFGDDWQHRVTIENIIEDYPYNYPQVIKFKGDCPIEDCGGIEGYYECIDVIEDTDNPESAERRAWAEYQGYGFDYDMDEVNEDLKESCYVILGKGDRRKQREIYDDMLDGKMGLNGSKTAKNKEPKLQSERQKREAMLQQIVDMAMSRDENQSLLDKAKKGKGGYSEELYEEDFIRSEVMKYIEELLSYDSQKSKLQLVDLLNSYSKEDLKEIAYIYQLRKISSLRKPELAKLLSEQMLMPETLKEAFLALRDDEIDAFERAIDYEEIYYMKDIEMELFQNLINIGYIGVRMDNQVEVPEDVIKVYKQVNTNAFKNLQKRISWLIACFDVASWFYGAVPVDVMVKLFNQRKDLKTDKRALLEDYEKIPQVHKDFILINDLFVHINLLEDDNYVYLMQNQGNKDYYIPMVDEIKDLTTNNFITNDPCVEELMEYFIHDLDVPEEEAKVVTRTIWQEINEGCDMHDVFDLINDNGICFNSDNDIYEFVPILNKFWNNTRMLLNRGFTPSELIKDQKKHIHPKGQGNRPTIIPGSSSAAKLLMEGKEHIEKLGFPIDFDANAKEIPVYSMSSGIDGSIEMKMKKIYPNDPCPCGSGKKYKKCCGR